MKKIKNLMSTPVLIGCACFVLISCSMNRELVEKQASSCSTVDKSANSLGPLFPFSITMNRVDLFLQRSASLTGTVTVQITSDDGTVVIGSTTVAGSSIISGVNYSKNSFYFPNLNLGSGTKYRIKVLRSNPHNYLNDYLYWAAHEGFIDHIDAYPKGDSNASSPSEPVDFAFISYSDGYTDQTQSTINYGYAINNSGYFFTQEFVPSKIWVIQL